MAHRNDTPPHAWKLANYNTSDLRKAANDLRDTLSGLVLESGERAGRDGVYMEAVKMMAVAADHIDRIEHRRGPHIVHTSYQMNEDTMSIIGTDIMGGIWVYNFDEEGWRSLPGRAVTPKNEVTVVPLKGGKGDDKTKH